MKKYMIISYILLSFIVLTSCKKEEQKDIYRALGIISITPDSMIIVLDNGERMLVENDNSIGTAIEDQNRVNVTFTMSDKTLPTGIDYIISIESIEKVLLKQVFELTPEKADSIGNDDLSITELWLGGDFLNLSFVYYGSTESHYINLIRYPGEIPTDTINLEIRHNSNNDSYAYSYSAFVSFDLKSLRNEAADSVILRIKAKEFNDRTFDKYYTYKY
jgi:hypothetical protein